MRSYRGDVGRAVILAAVMVLSVIALSVGAVGGSTVDGSATASSGSHAASQAAGAGDAVESSSSVTTITGCTVIDTPGVYELGADISATNLTCIEIVTSDVVLDGNGHTIHVANDTHGEAVNVTSPGSIGNVTIRNLSVQDGGTGIAVDARSDNVFVDVTIEGNHLNNTSDGIDVTADGNDSAVLLAILGNLINASDDGIDDVDTDGMNSSVSTAVFANAINATDRGIEDIYADEGNQTLDVIINGNHIVAGHDSIGDIHGDGDDTPVTVSVVNNTFNAGDDGIDDLDAFDENQTLDLVIRENEITTGGDGIEDIDAGGTNLTARVFIESNTIASDNEAIEDLWLEGHEGSTNLVIRDNWLNSTTADGIDDIDVEGDNRTARVVVVNNVIEADLGIDQIRADNINQTIDFVIKRNHITARNNEGIDDLYLDSNEGNGRLAIVDNTIDSSNESINDIDLDGTNGAFSVVIAENSLNSTWDEGIYDIDAYANNTNVEFYLLNNSIQARDDGLDDFDADYANQTVNVVIQNNEIFAYDEAIEDIDANSEGGNHNIAVINNTLNSTTDEGIEDLDAGGDDSEATITIAHNDIESEDEGIDDIDASGLNTSANITVYNNTILSYDYGIDYIEAYYDNQTLNITVVGNDIDAYYDAIYQIDATGQGTTADVTLVDNHLNSTDDSGIEDLWIADESDQDARLIYVNNTIVSEDDAVDDIDAYGINATVDMLIANSSFTSLTDYGFDSIDAEDDNQSVDLVIVNNDFDVQRDAFGEIWVDGAETTANISIINNDIVAVSSGIEDFDLDGNNQRLQIVIKHNRFSEFTDYGIAFDPIQIKNATTFDVLVKANTFAGNDSTATGIHIDPDTGIGTPPGSLVIDHNDISGVNTSVEIASGPVAGIEMHENDLAGFHYGVANHNTSNGSYVNATNNYWNASDGPSSAGPYEDPVTGTLANGTGTAVTNATPNVSNVHFDPYLENEPTPTFDVSIDSTNSDIDAGETLQVTATLANTDAGGEHLTKTVELVVGGVVRDSATVSLWADETTTITLTWTTRDGDGGDWDAIVRTASSSDSSRVTVNPGVLLEVGTSSLGYQSTFVGESRQQTVTVTNNEASEVTVQLSIDGDSAFSAPDAITLEAGETTDIPVSFAPTSAGAKSGTLTLTTNNSEAAVSLSGRAKRRPIVSLEPESHDFGNVNVGSEPTTTFTVENLGQGRLNITAVRFEGIDPDAFEIRNVGADQLGPGNTTTIEVAMLATGSGERSAQLIVETNDPDNRTVSAEVTGTVVETSLTVEPSSIDFGEVRVGENATATVTVTNDGDTDIELTDILVEGENARVFIPEGAEPGTLGPGDSQEITVVFAPRRAGAASARLSLVSGTDEVETIAVSLSGVGTAPQIAIDRTEIKFTNVSVGERQTATVTISNRGSEPLLVNKSLIVGANPGAFAFVDHPGSFELAPGEQRQVTVAIEPTSPGEKSAILRFESNDPRRPQINVWLTTTDTVVRIEPTQGEEEEDTAVNVTVRNVSAGETVSANVSQRRDRDRNASVENLNITVEEGGNFSVNITTSGDPLSTTGEFVPGERNGTQPAGYLNISHTIDNEDIEQVTFTMRVQKSMLEEANATIEDYTVYRRVDGEWVPLEKEVIGETPTAYLVEVTSPGLSDFTAGVEQPKFELLNATVTATQIGQGEETGVRVRIRNVGRADGTYTARLVLNGEVVDRRTVTVAAESLRVLEFRQEIDEPGTYTVVVNGVEVDEVEVTGADLTATGSPTGAGDGTSTLLPGFTPGLTVLVLVVLALAARRRE